MKVKIDLNLLKDKNIENGKNEKFNAKKKLISKRLINIKLFLFFIIILI
jgi:hypothetical protein